MNVDRNYGTVTLFPSELRGLILGQAVYRKCASCHGTGTEYYKWIDEDKGITEDIHPNEYDSSDPTHASEECTHCGGVGFQFVCWDENYEGD